VKGCLACQGTATVLNRTAQTDVVRADNLAMPEQLWINGRGTGLSFDKLAVYQWYSMIYITRR
jgi:hypothetical protein